MKGISNTRQRPVRRTAVRVLAGTAVVLAPLAYTQVDSAAATPSGSASALSAAAVTAQDTGRKARTTKARTTSGKSKGTPSRGTSKTSGAASSRDSARASSADAKPQRDTGASRSSAATTASPTQAAAATGDSLTASPAVYQGWKTFHVYCYRCHGVDAIGGQLAPDLRKSLSQGNVNDDAFFTVVKDGRLPKGMPAWKELLTDEQIENLWQYTKARSDNKLAAGRPKQAKS